MKEKTFKEFIRMAKAGLSDEQILSSSAMRAMFANIAAFVTERYGRRCQIILKNSGEGTACTDGNHIFIDINTSIICGMTLLDKVKYLIGMLYHETGHILFTDFVKTEKCRTSLLTDGTLCPAPVGINAEADEAYAQFLTLSAKEELRMPLAMLWKTVQNCVEDGAIEHFLRALFPGYAGCLTLVREHVFEEDPKLEQLRKEDACIDLILQEATSHDHKGELSCAKFDLTDFYENVMPLIGLAITERNAKERMKLINAIFAFTIAEIGIEPPESKDSEGGDSEEKDGESGGKRSGSKSVIAIGGSGGSGGSEESGESREPSASDSSEEGSEGGRDRAGDSKDCDPSSEAAEKDSSSTSGKKSKGTPMDAKKLSKILEHAAKEKHAGETVAPKGSTTSVKIEGDEESEEKKEEEAEKKERELEKALDDLTSEAALDEAETLAEKDVAKDLHKDDTVLSEKTGQKCVVQRVTFDKEDAYLASACMSKEKELSKAITTASRLLSREIEDRKLGEVQHGKIYGKAIDPSSIYRMKGGKMMSRKNPEDKPDMAVMCLIDESGSMSSGGKVAAAIDAAMVVNGFCEKLSLPLSIYGHTEDFDGNNDVRMLSYKEFGFDGDGKTNRRLMEITARENNRDGTAIRFCTKKLAARDEHIKLLLIVSDGLPEACNYCGLSACIDVREAVADARKKGITVVTAGIGSDRDRIKSVYVSSSVKPKDAAIYLDISDLNTLPKELVKIIRRNIQMVL